MGVELLVGCQHGDFHQTTDLRCMRQVRARDRNFGIIFQKCYLELWKQKSFLRKITEGNGEIMKSLTDLHLGGNRGNGAGEEMEKQKLGQNKNKKNCIPDGQCQILGWHPYINA